MRADPRRSTLATVRRYLQTFPGERHALASLVADLQREADCFVRSALPAHVTTSAAVLSPDRSRILLIHHKVVDAWIPPGGHVEGDGSLWASAVREVEEETGVTGLRLHPWAVTHGIPLDIDTHATPARPERGEPDHFHHDFRYLAVLDERCSLRPQVAEVHGVRWAPLDFLARSNDRRLTTLAAKLGELLPLVA